MLGFMRTQPLTKFIGMNLTIFRDVLLIFSILISETFAVTGAFFPYSFPFAPHCVYSWLAPILASFGVLQAISYVVGITEVIVLVSALSWPLASSFATYCYLSNGCENSSIWLALGLALINTVLWRISVNQMKHECNQVNN